VNGVEQKPKKGNVIEESVKKDEPTKEIKKK